MPSKIVSMQKAPLSEIAHKVSSISRRFSNAGGDEYLTKPVEHAALVARVKSMLRIKSLHDRVLEQSGQ